MIPNADTNPLFTQPLQDFFAANQAFFDPDADGLFTVRNIVWQVEELGPRNVTTRSDSYNLTGGLRGDFQLGVNSWAWDAFYQFSRADLNLIQLNKLSSTRVALGLDPVITPGGDVVCRAGDVLGCIPVSIFGTDALTEEMADFLTVTAGRQDQFTREIAGASVTGNLLELPAGPLASAFGLEWRQEEFRTVPSQADLSGEIGNEPFPIINGGEYDIFEVFGEVRVPLLEGVTGIDHLALEAAVRFSDYSTIGSVTTWRGAVDWKVNDWARVRAGVSRAIRAPNLNELFEPQDTKRDSGNIDPCVETSFPTPTEQQLCIEQGVPAAIADSLPDLEPGFPVLRGGNPNLQEEEADTVTIGVVLSPMPEFSIAVDYFDIDIEDAISPVLGQVIVDACFASNDINSTECQAIHRLSSGQIDFVDTSLLNVATRSGRGVDIQVDYAFELPEFLSLPGNDATLDLSLVFTQQFDQSTQVVATQPTIECAGFYGGPCSSDRTRITPELSGLLNATWRSGGASLTARFDYLGELDLHPDAFPIEVTSLSARTYVDLNGGYEFGDNIRLFGGIENVLDKDPPALGIRAGGDSGTNVETFDILGRRYFIGASVGFH